MAKDFILPDGRLITGIPDEYTDAEIRARVMRSFPDMYQKELEKEQGFIPSLKRSFKESVKESGPTALAGLEAPARTMGLDSAANWLEQAQGAPSETTIDPVHLRGIDSWKKLKQFTGESMGSGFGSTLMPIASGGIGAMAGAAAGPGGALLGGIAGAGATALPLNIGDLYKELQSEGVPKNEAAKLATMWGPVISVPDLVSMGVLAKPFLGAPKHAVVQELAKKLASEGFLKTAGKGIGKGMALEGITEGPVQGGIQEAVLANATNTPFFTSDRMEKMAESGIAGAMVGGPFGGVGRFAERGQARNKLRDDQRRFEDSYPLENVKRKNEILSQEQQDALNEKAGIERDFDAQHAREAAEIIAKKQANQVLLAGHEPYGHQQNFNLSPGGSQGPLTPPMSTQGTINLDPAQDVFSQAAKEPSTSFIQHDQGLEKVAPQQAQQPNTIVPKFAEDLVPEPIKLKSGRAPDLHNLLTSTLHDSYLTTRGSKPTEQSFRSYFGDLTNAKTPEQVVARIAAKAEKTRDPAKKELYEKWLENLEAKGLKHVKPTEPAGTPGDAKAVIGGSQPSVGVSTPQEGSPSQSEKIDAGGLGTSGELTGQRDGGEGTVTDPLKARPAATEVKEGPVPYGDMGVGAQKPVPRPEEESWRKAIEDSQKFLSEDKAKRDAAPKQKFNDPANELSSEDRAMEDADKIAINSAITDQKNPLGKYVRDTGSLDNALEEIAFHRVWGMEEGKSERLARGVGWTKGEAQLTQKPYKEVKPHSSGGAEAWIKKNLSERGKERYRKLIDAARNEHDALMRTSSHGPKEGEGTEKGPRVFKEGKENARRMTRALHGKLSELNDIVERAGRLIHAGDETTARKRVEDWVLKNDHIAKDLRNYLGLKGRASLVEELMERGLAHNRVEYGSGQGIPLSPMSKRFAERGRLNDVLFNIASNSPNELNREIAKRFLEISPNTKLGVDNFRENGGAAEHYKLSSTYKGSYIPDENLILLNSDPSFNGLNEHTFLHEVAHALTNTIIRAVNERTDRHLNQTQRQAYHALNNLYNKVKKDIGGNPEFADFYGFKNLKEFVAEAFSNPKFQERLHGQPISPKAEGFGSALRNLWGEFVRAIQKLIGIDNALAKTFELSDLLLTKPHPEWFDRGDVTPHEASFDELLGGEKAPQDHGPMGAAVRGFNTAKETPKNVVMNAAKKAWVELERLTVNQRWGVTRFMPSSALIKKDGETRVNPAALIQGQEYGTQIAGASLSTGYVGFTEFGMPVVKEDKENNIGTLMSGISALPESLGGDKVHAFNRIASNLSYMERMENAEKKKANARQVIEQVEQKLKDAKNLSGPMAYQAIRKAKIAKKEAAKLLRNLDYDKPDYITQESVEQAKKAADLPEVKKVLDIVHNMNMHDINFYESVQMISKEVADEWRQNRFYVNLGRVMEDIEQTGGIMRGAGRMVNLRTLKDFTGSDRPVDDILANIVRQRLFMTDAGVRNQASVAALDFLMSEGHAGIEKIAGKPVDKQNVVQVWEKGQRTYYTVEDASAFKSFQGLQEQSGMIMNALEGVTAVFREAITLTPPFIARNMFKDSTGAWAVGFTNANLFSVWGKVGSQFIKSLPSAIKEIKSGGVHVPKHEVSLFGISGSREMTSIIREKEAVLRRAMTSEFGTSVPKDWADKIDRYLSVAHHVAQNVTGESELATRETVYQDTKRKTGSQEEAIVAARNVLDWRMRGGSSTITYAKKLIPFFNSNLQGFYTIYRAMAGRLPGVSPEQGQRMLANRLLCMAAVSSAYAMMMSDDEDYQQVKKDVADNNWLIPVGDGVFIKAPIPYEIGVIAKTLPENLIRYMNGDQSGRQFVDTMKHGILNQLPGILPQFAKPAIETMTGYDFFTGKNIESENQRRKDVKDRFGDYTSELAKSLGGTYMGAEVSPLKVDHLLQGYFGSIGSFMTTAVVDPMIEAVQDKNTGDKPTKPFQEKAGVRAFLTNPAQSRDMDTLYEIRDITSKPKYTFDEMMREGRAKDAEEFMGKETKTGKTNAELMGLSDAVSSITGKLADLRRAQHQITSDDRLSADEKAEKIKELKRYMREISAGVIEQLRGASGL